MTTDHYEVLQVSPNAHPLIIAKAYRLLAAVYHPDKPETGDNEHFLRVVEAYRVLSDPVRRATYDRRVFGVARADLGELRDETRRPAGDRAVEDENELRHSLLQALYTIRRNQPQNPGLSLMALAELLGCSIEVMQFTLWYLRGKKLIDAVDDGNVAITVLGVDHIEASRRQAGDDDGMLAIPAKAIEAASDDTPINGDRGHSRSDPRPRY